MPEKIRKVHVQLAGNWIDSIDWMMEQKIQSPKEKDTVRRFWDRSEDTSDGTQRMPRRRPNASQDSNK